MANINVVAVRRVWFQGQQIVMPVQGAVSDERGAFLITKLAPGEYILYAQPIPTEQTDKDGSSLVRTYYGNTPLATNATSVTLDRGAALRDITIQLQRSPTYHVRGSVKGPKDLWRDGAVELRTLNEQPMAIISGMSNIAEDGSFDFLNVSPGLYALTFRSSLAGGTERVEVASSDVTIDASANSRQTVRATWAPERS